MEIQSAKLIITVVDESTGEIITREATLGDFKEKKTSTTRTKKIKDNGDPTPKIMLLDNKLTFNKAAQDLTKYEPENKYDVTFEKKKGKVIIPIIREDPSKGNRLTKSFTISFRGSRNDNLREYGDVFELIPYEGHEGWFKLKGNAPEKEDDIIDVPEEISVDDESEDISVDDGIEATDINFDLDI